MACREKAEGSEKGGLAKHLVGVEVTRYSKQCEYSSRQYRARRGEEQLWTRRVTRQDRLEELSDIRGHSHFL